MEPPSTAPPTSFTTTTAPLSAPPYSESVDSSPRSRTTDTWEPGSGDALPPVPGGPKLRLMCSYGGHIVPRPHDKSLCYVGGETRIVVVERNSTLPELLQRLSQILLNGRPFTLKYQLPNEDLDSLITVSSEEDLENMVDEYDRLSGGSNPAKNSRIRLFLFPSKLEVAASMGPILDGSNKSDDWFFNALNGADLLHRNFSDPSSVNCLLGLEESGRSSGNLDPNSNEGEGQRVSGDEIRVGLVGVKGKVGNLSNQDVHSVLDSAVLETNSSFGSAHSAPAMVNLPRIRVHVEEGAGGGGGGAARVFDQRAGIEDQFAQMGVNAQKMEEGFVMMSSPPSNFPVAAGVPVGAAGVPVGVAGEYTNRIISDDERSDHGAPPMGYRTRQPPQMVMVPNSQPQNKQINEDLPTSPVSVSSDSSLSNATTRQKPVIYQDPSVNSRMPANFIDPNTGGQVQVQQVPDPGYVLQSHYDQQLQQQSIHSQQQQQQQQAQPQQFNHASNQQFVHHHPPSGMPLSYYPVYPPQQQQQQQQPNHQHQHQIDQRYPVYYMPAGQTHNFNMQPPPPKAEIPQAGVYRATGNPNNPQIVQQQPFMGYSQMPHPSQSMAPAYADPAHTQVYFTQPFAPQLAAQYQTMTSAPTMVMSDSSSTALPNDAVKPQIRTSQPL